MRDLGPALRWLLDRSHLLPPSELPGVVDEAARLTGALGAVVYLVDRDQAQLVPLGCPDRGPLSVEATLPGRAYKTVLPLPSSADGQHRLWVPLLDGAERLGVLELLLDGEPRAKDAQRAVTFASLVAELVMSRNQYTDLYLQARAPRPLALAAELLWRQLPPLTYSTDRFTITGLLEPWSEVGGDAFDYSCDERYVHLAVVDGMGHGLSATLLTSVALAAYRRARRQGRDLLEIAMEIDEALAAQFGDDSFVTGLLARLDLERGLLSLVSAGHPFPMLLRDSTVLHPLEGHLPDLPLGLGAVRTVVAELPLQPGDVVLMYTDGLVESRRPGEGFFGIERLADFFLKEGAAQQAPPETLRRLMRAVLEHQQGQLQDDVTCLLLEWVTGNQKRMDPAPP